MLADLPRVTVGERDPVELVHDEGVDTGILPGRLRQRLELRGRIGAVQRLLEPRGVREGLSGGQCPVPGVGHGVPPGLHDESHHCRRDEQHHKHQLKEKNFPGNTARRPGRPYGLLLSPSAGRSS